MYQVGEELNYISISTELRLKMLLNLNSKIFFLTGVGILFSFLYVLTAKYPLKKGIRTNSIINNKTIRIGSITS